MKQIHTQYNIQQDILYTEITNQLYFSKGRDTAKNGIKKYIDKTCDFHADPNISMILNMSIEEAITTLWPTSSPFIPA